MAIEFEPVIEALNDCGVSYVVVGGLAVLLHGVDRLTADLDVVLDLTPGPCLRAMRSLTALGYRPRPPVPAEDFADAGARRRWIEEKGMQVFSLWDPRNRLPILDLFVAYPIEFEALLEQSARVPLGASEVPVAAVEHLIRMKTGTGRSTSRTSRPSMQEEPDHDSADWGSFEQAEAWRREHFAARTPEQKLAWLKSVLVLAYQSGARPIRREGDVWGRELR